MIPKLEVRQLRFLGLGPFSFRLGPGEILCLQGPSGVGKSQLLRCLVDLSPYEGEIYLQGESIEHIAPPELRRRVGYLPAVSAWWGEKVAEHFQAPAQLPLERLGFGPEVLSWPIQRLSTGERQRLALLRLLENRPEILLLDEPTASLDPANRASMEALLLEYHREQQAPLLWVSHDPAQVARVSTQILQVTKEGLV